MAVVSATPVPTTRPRRRSPRGGGCTVGTTAPGQAGDMLRNVAHRSATMTTAQTPLHVQKNNHQIQAICVAPSPTGSSADCAALQAAKPAQASPGASAITGGSQPAA